MDPTQALANALSAIADSNFSAALSYLEALEKWLESGGFPPDVQEAFRKAGLSDDHPD